MKTTYKVFLVQKQDGSEPKMGASRVLPAVAVVSSIASIMAVPISYGIGDFTTTVGIGMVASIVLGLVGILVAEWSIRTFYPAGDWDCVLWLAIVAFVWDVFSIAALAFIAYAFAGWF
jgi:hypothetical protein